MVGWCPTASFGIRSHPSPFVLWPARKPKEKKLFLNIKRMSRQVNTYTSLCIPVSLSLCLHPLMLNVTEIRKDFPILQRETSKNVPLVYLDSTATSQKPVVVIEA